MGQLTTARALAVMFGLRLAFEGFLATDLHVTTTSFDAGPLINLSRCWVFDCRVGHGNEPTRHAILDAQPDRLINHLVALFDARGDQIGQLPTKALLINHLVTQRSRSQPVAPSLIVTAHACKGDMFRIGNIQAPSREGMLLNGRRPTAFIGPCRLQPWTLQLTMQQFKADLYTQPSACTHLRVLREPSPMLM